MTYCTFGGDRLAAYEDTGLGPDEITTEPYGCVFYRNRKCNLDGDFCAEGPGCPWEIDAENAKHMLELAQAEKDGRLVVLPPNDPLTLEELREMDGEPVWISPVKENGKVFARWMLVSGYNHNKDIYLFAPSCNITQGYDGKSYGKTWLAYRYKPEEGTT